MLTSLVQPDPKSREVYTGVASESSKDIVLVAGVLLGQVDPVSHYEHPGKDEQEGYLSHHVWAVAQHVCAPTHVPR